MKDRQSEVDKVLIEIIENGGVIDPEHAPLIRLARELEEKLINIQNGETATPSLAVINER